MQLLQEVSLNLNFSVTKIELQFFSADIGIQCAITLFGNNQSWDGCFGLGNKNDLFKHFTYYKVCAWLKLKMSVVCIDRYQIKIITVGKDLNTNVGIYFFISDINQIRIFGFPEFLGEEFFNLFQIFFTYLYFLKCQFSKCFLLKNPNRSNQLGSSLCSLNNY